MLRRVPKPFATAGGQFLAGWMPFLPPKQQCQSSKRIVANANKARKLHFKRLHMCGTQVYVKVATRP